MSLVCIYDTTETLVFSFSTRNPMEDLGNMNFIMTGKGTYMDNLGYKAVVHTAEKR